MAKNKQPRMAKPKKPKNNKGGLGKFFFAIITAIIVFIALIVIQSGILSNYETTQVVVAKSNIPKGTDVNETNYKDYFGYADLDSRLVPEGAITDIELAKDNVTSQDIATNEFLNANALMSVDEIAQNIAGETGKVEDLVVSGFAASDLSNSVCGILRRGDTVDITLIYNDDLGTPQTTVLSNVYVKNAYDGGGVEIYAGNTATATMFNFLLTQEEDDLLNKIITNNGTIRIRKTNDPEF